MKLFESFLYLPILIMIFSPEFFRQALIDNSVALRFHERHNARLEFRQIKPRFRHQRPRPFLRKAGFLSLALARFAHGRDYSELVILRQEGSSVGAPGEAGAIQPVKVRPGSECCMAEGDDRDEAYTATCEGYGKPRAVLA